MSCNVSASCRSCERTFAGTCGILFLFAITSLAFGQGRLLVKTVPAEAGQDVELPIAFQSAAQRVALQFDIVFPPTDLAIGKPFPGEAAEDHLIRSREITKGHWRVVVYSPTNVPLGLGDVVRFPVSVAGGAGNGLRRVELEDPVILADASGTSSVPDAIIVGGISIGDRDADGIVDRTEDASPNGGDANDDGMLDSEQPHVTSFPTASDSGYLTLRTVDPLMFLEVEASTSPSLPGMPSEVDFPLDFVSFRLSGLESGGSASVRLTVPGGMALNTFYNYGATPNDPSPHWYEFLFDGTSGAEFSGSDVIIHFTDGERGDHDLTVNGEISALGGPGSQDPHVLLLPFYRGENGGFTGFAVSNYSPRIANIRYEAYGPEGTPLDLNENPAEFELGGSAQLALQGFQVFSIDENANQLGWVELSSDNDQIGSFFQFGTDDLSQLDGSVSFVSQAKKLYLSRVFQGDEGFRGQPSTTLVSLVNPNASSISLTISLNGMDSQGAAVESSVNRNLPAKGMIFESVEELFGVPDVAQGSVVIEVAEGDGAVAFEQIQLQDQETVIGLNAHYENSFTESYSAQLAAQAGLFTNVNLVNTANQARTVTLAAIQADGTNLAAPVQVVLLPGEQYSQDAREIFSNTDFVGSLRVAANGAGVLGDVIFGDRAEFEYAAALPLQTETLTEAAFNQVANIKGFFTGLAFYNPGSEDAEVEIRVISAAGELVGEITNSLPSGERLSKLVDELVSDSRGQAGGYVRIRSDQPLIAQLLFGAVKAEGGISLLSAVPPTVISKEVTP